MGRIERYEVEDIVFEIERVLHWVEIINTRMEQDFFIVSTKQRAFSDSDLEMMKRIAGARYLSFSINIYAQEKGVLIVSWKFSRSDLGILGV
jgi:hypothetical protein